ncbi:MAG: hypothetical protein C0622_02310 [Desulfuromonas sp.]|nr:MAG: hypothetical protein C0622_02310 [Desulfuromonas sp.]
MAEKGDRARLEPLARQRYIETGNLTQVAEELGVSRQTLTNWKHATLKPGAPFDEWDRAREEKRSRIDRLRGMFDEQLSAMENLQPLQRDSKMMDALAKLGALIEKWEGMEQRARKQALEEAAQAVGDEARAQGMTDEQADFWRRKVLGVKG